MTAFGTPGPIEYGLYITIHASSADEARTKAHRITGLAQLAGVDPDVELRFIWLEVEK